MSNLGSAMSPAGHRRKLMQTQEERGHSLSSARYDFIWLDQVIVSLNTCEYLGLMFKEFSDSDGD